MLELNPEHSRVDHSVLGVLWGKVCAPSAPDAVRSRRGETSLGSQLAGADGRLQLVGQGSEDLVELLIAPGLTAAGTLTAPEEAHLELRAEYLQELRPGLEPLQLDLSIGVVQASMVCHCPGSLQVGQHHLHAMLRAAPGLRALGWGRVTLQQGDEGQHMRKRGVAQRRAFCREKGSRPLEIL